MALVALLEGVLALGVALIEIPDALERADAYREVSWGRAYFRELRQANRCCWKPYVYWRHGPFSGKYVNVDDKGIRYTAKSNDPVSTATPYTIFMFGGSTLWGTGVADAQTIPSFVASMLRAKGVPVNVVNFGESGYVSTQEVIELILQLQKGNAPQLAIFYDGVNDTYSAYQQGVAGIPQNEFNRVGEFRASAGALVTRAIRELPTSKLARRVVRRSARGRAIHPSDERNLARDVVDVYCGNIKLVQSLSRSFGFRSRFYWQPTIFTKKTLSSYEDGARRRLHSAEGFFSETRQEIQKRLAEAGTEGALKDMSDLLLAVSSPVYIDWCHLSEQGNLLVAQAIVADILPLIRGSGLGNSENIALMRVSGPGPYADQWTPADLRVVSNPAYHVPPR